MSTDRRRFLRRCLMTCAVLALTAGSADAQTTLPAASDPWPVRTREHYDLWLHGLALLIDDTTRIPLYRRGYAEDIRVARKKANVSTRLDAERDRLRARFTANPTLPLAAQFIPFAFDSWESLHRAADAFAAANGDPRRARDQASAQSIAILAGTFATTPDREWLRVFIGALDDEETKFYHSYWTATQLDRSAARASVDSAWKILRPKLQKFLTNTQQRAGDLVLSLPLGGEGRTSNTSMDRNTVVVGAPLSSANAVEALYTAVHEFVGSIAGPVVADNVTPADQRAGLADRYVGVASTRAGLMLLQRLAPDLAAGYARFYLGVIGSSVTGDPIAALTTAFPLPPAMVEALSRQIDITIGGI